jgi:hypothetical protein
MAFNIIRHAGQLDEAEVDGVKVHRQDAIWVPEYNGFVKCAPYQEHFIFSTPHAKVRSPAYQCTCGSFACVVGPSGYVWDASPQGKLFVCYHSATFGVHQGGSRWI